MISSAQILVLAGPGLDEAQLERCVHAAGHRVVGLAYSVADLRISIAEYRTEPARPGRGLVLLIHTAIAGDADSAAALGELLRSSGLPAVRLEPERDGPSDEAPLPAHDGAAGHVTCALTPRHLALAVELASTRNELARADVERARCHDEIRQLNGVIARRAGELQAVNDELEAFGFSVSHDLRAPLRAIDGLSKIIIERLDDQLDPRIQAYLQHICEASQRMSRLIDELLGLSRLMRTEMRLQTCDLSAMACDILALLQQSSPERAVAVAITPGILVRADPTLLHVALENLLGNAWKFTSTTPAPCIELGVTRKNGQTAYFVRDDGAGFDMANAGKLFGAFQRMHSAGEFEGTGIGLAKVQRIVRRHGGDIWAEAAVARGATFTFTLS